MSSPGMPRRSANLALAQVPTMTPVMIIKLYHRSANGPRWAMTGSMSISTRGSMAEPSIAPAEVSALVWTGAEVALQRVQGQRVQHVARLQPAPPGDLHAIVEVDQLVVGVRVGTDHDLHAELLRPARIV